MTARDVSSTPVLRTALIWSGIVTAALAVVGGIAGLLVAGVPGLASALAGVVVAAVFLAVTAVSILVANRWFGDPLYVPIFFGVVLGGWVLKLIVFIVALILLRGQPWLVGHVFFIAIVASILASLVVDALVLTRMRIPHASDVTLPEAPPDEDGQAPRTS